MEHYIKPSSVAKLKTHQHPPAGGAKGRRWVKGERLLWGHAAPSVPVPYAESTNTAHGPELCQQGEALLESLQCLGAHHK